MSRVARASWEEFSLKIANIQTKRSSCLVFIIRNRILFGLSIYIFTYWYVSICLRYIMLTVAFLKLWNSLRFEFALIFIICLLNECLYLHANEKTMRWINSWKRILSVFYIICIHLYMYPTCPDFILYITSDILLQWLNPTQKEILIWNQDMKSKVAPKRASLINILYNIKAKIYNVVFANTCTCTEYVRNESYSCADTCIWPT